MFTGKKPIYSWMETQVGKEQLSEAQGLCQKPSATKERTRAAEWGGKEPGCRGRDGGWHLTTYLVISWPVADAQHWFPALAHEGLLGLNLLL